MFLTLTLTLKPSKPSEILRAKQLLTSRGTGQHLTELASVASLVPHVSEQAPRLFRDSYSVLPPAGPPHLIGP
jgi:hypothetical protein